MTAIAAMLLMTAASGADDSWLEARTDATCSAANLPAQISERVVGERNPTLTVKVELRPAAEAFVASLVISQEGRAVGTKLLAAPTCEEALEAVTAVVALAVSRPRSLAPAASERLLGETGTAPASDSVVVAELMPAASVKPRRDVESPNHRSYVELRDAPSSAAGEDVELRIAGSAGVDVGTLAEPAAVLSAGLRAEAPWGELRGFARYGLPSTREEISLLTERTRAEFLALSVDYCRPLDEARWLGLCGGMETSVRHTARSEKRADEPAREDVRYEAAVGPVLSAALAYRTSRWAPELDVSMSLPMPETESGLRPAFRASLGAALPF